MYVSLARIGHGGTSGSKGDWLSGYLGFPTSIMKAGKEGLGMMWGEQIHSVFLAELRSSYRQLKKFLTGSGTSRWRDQ